MEFRKIEQKWQKKWEESKIYEVTEISNKPKYYVLDMFPYPSGAGLHIGHAFVFSLGDIFARFKRLQGYNVLYPIGYDALGLPAENAAIKDNTHPEDYTKKSIANFMHQQKAMGWSYDWSRTVNTSTPEFYQWDQWIFLQMLKKGIAYRKKAPVNWCHKCQSVLANEQVTNGKCWRHEDTNIEIKHLEQWFLKITNYAEELLNHDKLKWPETAKKLQKHWIGKSYGTQVIFKVNDKDFPIFTTRPDTLYGVTFMVISAQHTNLMDFVAKEQETKVKNFLKKIKSVSEKDMEELEKEGVFTGSYAVNPLTAEKVPIWAGNFVLAEYGTGMVMAVPAHDQRDFEFAKKYDIPIKIVIQPEQKLKLEETKKAYTESGKLINSGEFNGLDNQKAIEEITKHLESLKLGKKTIQYKLRDWLISRQRYWGTPIPIIYCKKCGITPVSESELPIKLPKEVTFGEGNPLLTNEKWVNVKCPKCNSNARRETDTMDTFANSSWYFLRYTDPHNNQKIFDTKKANYWAPIDQYIGGPEHITMHLIYIRFYTKFLRDLGLLNFDEPALRYFTQGIVKGSDGEKMSKSKNNIVEPLEMIERFGADSLRLYLVSNSAPDSDFDWNDIGMISNHKFIVKVYERFSNFKSGATNKKIESKLHKTIKDITVYIDEFKHNLAVIKLRELFKIISTEPISKETAESFIKMLHVYCPFITEELWEKLGNKNFISSSIWPKYDIDKIDPIAEYKDELIEHIKGDITKVLELINLKNPNRITLIISAQWKYHFLLKFKHLIQETRDSKSIIKSIMQTELKRNSQDIMKLIPLLLKDASKVPLIILTQETEKETIENSKNLLENEFNCSIEIDIAESSSEKKANNAMPGKPAILIE